ncbi:GH25 family lysozyme [Sporolactobacillus sp. CQH2019]|uniref:GH25 family lysozyme n=1 Tax=Sporolactobacillus sp. CQH2019 TaxID=3023512 RepID=UPI002367B2B7|nr:GH25 family lysozyme [Sporolactobacillus sp. CQH2019]MDD9149268.1 GH25 family lysozyme [Sporolactobacillus sp. CQH2019]
MTKYKGIDIASMQGNVDFKKVKAAGYSFVIIKATEGSEAGSHYINPYFRQSVTNAEAAGLVVHIYHFFRGVSEADARAEADWLKKNLAGINAKGYLFCDAETTNGAPNAGALTGFVNAFFDRLEAAGHKKLGIYSGLYFFKDHLAESQLRPGLLKWVAQYNDHCDRAADIWQHTSIASVPGITGNVDEDIAYTDKLIGAGAPASSVKPAPNPSSRPTSGGILKQGDRGSAVLDLQKRLSSVYFYPDKPAVNHGCDGIYGPKTADAVRRFQITHSCTGDGVYGPQTAAALDKAIAAQKAAPTSRPVHTVVSGDNLWDIAQKNKTTVQQLKNINHLTNDTIFPGQKLYLK